MKASMTGYIVMSDKMTEDKCVICDLGFKSQWEKTLEDGNLLHEKCRFAYLERQSIFNKLQNWIEEDVIFYALLEELEEIYGDKDSYKKAQIFYALCSALGKEIEELKE